MTIFVCSKNQQNWKLLLLLPLLIFSLPPADLQQFNNQTSNTCTPETLNARTIFDFWHENVADCDVDITNLVFVHKKLNLNRINYKTDQISQLLDNHISTTLMEKLFNQLIVTISTKSLNTKPDLEQVINQLYNNEKDAKFIVKIWQKVLDECSQFMKVEDILQQLLLLTNGDLKLMLLEYFMDKYGKQYSNNPRFLPLLTFGVTSVLQQRQLQRSPIGDPSIGRLLSKLPEQLLTIYQSWNYNVSLQNRFYNEFIFPERNNGPSPNKRYLFTFIPTKNTFRVKGKFKLQFNPKGLLTFGAPYDGTYRYLTAEKNSAFICLDCAIEVAQWWQVLWTAGDQSYLLFQNLATEELLCSSSSKFNDNLVLIWTLATKDHMTDLLCQWKVMKRDK